MDGFSLDDIRDTFLEDMERFSGQIRSGSRLGLQLLPRPEVIDQSASAMGRVTAAYHGMSGTAGLVELGGLHRLSARCEHLSEQLSAALGQLNQQARIVRSALETLDGIPDQAEQSIKDLLGDDRAAADGYLGKLSEAVDQHILFVADILPVSASDESDGEVLDQEEPAEEESAAEALPTSLESAEFEFGSDESGDEQVSGANVENVEIESPEEATFSFGETETPQAPVASEDHGANTERESTESAESAESTDATEFSFESTATAESDVDH